MSSENTDTVIGVVGAGTMGNGIAQVAARAGYNVIMHDVREEFLKARKGCVRQEPETLHR